MSVMSVMSFMSITLALSLTVPAVTRAAPTEQDAAPTESAATPAEAEPEPDPQPEIAPVEHTPEPEPEVGQATQDEAVISAPAPPPAPLLSPPIPIEVDPANYRMVLAGNIVIGLGGAALIAMAVGLGLRSDALTQRQALRVGAEPDLDAIARQDQRIQSGTITGITGGAAAGVLFVTGITLVALGYERERERRLTLPTAAVGPQGVGLHWSMRF